MKGKTECSDIRIEPAQNGLILRYTEKTPRKSSNKSEYEMSSYNYDDKKEVFTIDQSAEAVARMMKLVGGMMPDASEDAKDNY